MTDEMEIDNKPTTTGVLQPVCTRQVTIDHTLFREKKAAFLRCKKTLA